MFYFWSTSWFGSLFCMSARKKVTVAKLNTITGLSHSTPPPLINNPFLEKNILLRNDTFLSWNFLNRTFLEILSWFASQYCIVITPLKNALLCLPAHWLIHLWWDSFNLELPFSEKNPDLILFTPLFVRFCNYLTFVRSSLLFF